MIRITIPKDGRSEDLSLICTVAIITTIHSDSRAGSLYQMPGHWGDKTYNQAIGPDLLKLKDVLIEVILQVFIGVVDAELFKAVAIKILKPKDVQNSNGITLKQIQRVLKQVSTICSKSANSNINQSEKSKCSNEPYCHTYRTSSQSSPLHNQPP